MTHKACLLWRYDWFIAGLTVMYTLFMIFGAVLAMKRGETSNYLPLGIGTTGLAWVCSILASLHCMSWRISINADVLTLRGCSNACFWFMTYAAGVGILMMAMITSKSLNEHGSFMVLPFCMLTGLTALSGGIVLGVGSPLSFELASTEIEWTTQGQFDCLIGIKSGDDALRNRMVYIAGVQPSERVFLKFRQYLEAHAKRFKFRAVAFAVDYVDVKRKFRVHPLYAQRIPTVTDVYLDDPSTEVKK